MNVADIPAEQDSPQAGDGARLLFERQAAMLGQLAEAGLEIALTIRDQVKADAAGAADDKSNGLEAAALAYARVAKAVRLTLMLQTQAIKAMQHQDHLVKTAGHGVVRDRKTRVERIVERIAAADRDDADEAERLAEEAAERLDQDDLYGDVLARPVSELVALVCKDLGLDPDWLALAEEAWAREEMAGGEAGWPLAALGETQPWTVGLERPKPGGGVRASRFPPPS